MTEAVSTLEKIAAGLDRRHRAERRFRRYGRAAISVGLVFLGVLFTSIAWKGMSAFTHTVVSLDVFIDPAVLDPKGTGDGAVLVRGDYRKLIRNTLERDFASVQGRSAKRELNKLLSSGAAFQLRTHVLANPQILGKSATIWVPATPGSRSWRASPSPWSGPYSVSWCAWRWPYP
jgi:phosphate transport system permease protein